MTNILLTFAAGLMLIAAVAAIVAGFIALMPWSGWSILVIAVLAFVYGCGAAIKHELGIR